MSLEKFLGKKKDYSIGGEQLTLKPLSVKDMDLLLSVGSGKGEPDPTKVRDFVVKVLENSYPGEDVGDISLAHLQPLLEACLDVHGFGVDTPKPAPLAN